MLPFLEVTGHIPHPPSNIIIYLIITTGPNLPSVTYRHHWGWADFGARSSSSLLPVTIVAVGSDRLVSSLGVCEVGLGKPLWS